jgi:trimeric autotransporter adhesin
MNQRSLNLTAAVCVLLAAALCAPQHALGQYSISTVAGGGPNNLPALQSSIGFAVGVAQDTAGNLYISDSYSSQVFKVSTAGTLTVVAGNGTIGYSGDGGPATSAQLSMPEGIAVDGSGNIFIADTGNSVIREVVAGTGNIQTVAGNFSLGAGYSGDGGPATSAQLNDPYGVSVDGAGNIFIADTDNSVIREVATGSGNIQTVAGNFTKGAGFSGDGTAATNAQLDLPEGVFLDGTGNIFIADTNNSVIRVVNTGSAAVTIAGITIPAGDIQTVAGTNYDSGFGSACMFTGSGGPATSAYLCEPVGVFVDASENIFIADTDNYTIREVGTTGTLTTVAGTPGTFGYSGNGGLATSAVLNYTSAVVVDGAGNIYVADTDNFVVREVTAANGNIQAFAGNNTLAYSGDGGPATGAALNFPGGVFTDSSGNIYIVDTDSSVIRVVNPGTQTVTVAGVTIQPGDIQTIAGTGIACLVPAVGGCGDGGPPTSAELNYPFGIFVDGSGNIFIADTGLPLTESSAIRVINPGIAPITIAGVTIQPGTIQTVVGTLGTAGFAGDGGLPTSAQLFNPEDVVVDASGDIYISDSENSAIRVVNSGTQALTIAGVTIQPGSIQTVAGTPPTACADPSAGCGDSGAASSASLNFPGAISLDSAGNIYIADTFNSAIRVVNSGTQPITIAGTTIQPADILTVAGTLGRGGYSGDAGAPNVALLNTPWGVSVDSLGNIFIADTNNSAIRQVVAVDGTIQTIAGNGTAGFSGDGGSATSAALDGPQTVVLSGGGKILIADSQSSRIRQLVSTVSVSVVPASATVALGLTQQFLATVTGASNTNVTWQVNGVTGGNATVGTISTAGLYQAPATAPASAVTVTAISDANGTTSGSATVTIAASGAPAVSVSTNPPGVTVVYTSTTQAFTASVTGESNTAVTWEVNNVAGGAAATGTIDGTGLYTAPSAVPVPALVMITAVSQADATVSGSYPITIVTAPAATQPAPQTISPGATANFSISLNANTGNPHNPITLSCLQSSLPTGASCTFSPAIITPSSSAVPFSLAVSVPSTGASLQQRQSTWLASQVWWSVSPLAGFLLLAGKRKKSRLRWMSLAMFCLFLLTLVGCGGGGSKSTTQNPVTYNIQVQGQTAAQPNPVPITMVELTVQ